MIVDKINELFNTYDGIIMPAAASIAPKFDEKTDKLSDKYLILKLLKLLHVFHQLIVIWIL